MIFNKFTDEDSAKEWFENTILGEDRKDKLCTHFGGIRTSNSKHSTMPYRYKDCDKHFI